MEGVSEAEAAARSPETGEVIVGRNEEIDDLKVGAVIRLAEEHYCYGLGTLHLRLTAVPNVQAIWNRLEWIELTGVELRWNGCGDVRTVLARVTGIQIGVPRRHRQRREQRPAHRPLPRQRRAGRTSESTSQPIRRSSSRPGLVGRMCTACAPQAWARTVNGSVSGSGPYGEGTCAIA